MLDQRAISEGRVVLFDRLNEKNKTIEGHLILDYHRESEAVRVGFKQTYSLSFPSSVVRQIFDERRILSVHLICYLDAKTQKVIKVEKKRLEVVLHPDVWRSANLDMDPSVRLFLLRLERNQKVRAAPILEESEDNLIVVGSPTEFPTTLRGEALRSLAEQSDKWFLGSTVFGVLVDYEISEKGKLIRARS